jgi:ubiquitin C-terminal hydrolase
MNPGGKNLCFSNAAITCLLNIPKLNSFLMANTFKQMCNGLLAEFCLLLELPNNQKNISTQNIRKMVQTNCFEAEQITRSFDDNNQHDCVEFIQSLLEHFWGEDDIPLDLRENVFGGLFQDIITCSCGHTEELSVQNMPDILSVPMKGENIQTCLECFFSREQIIWKCPSCFDSNVSKSINIIKEPTTLLLQVMRFEYSQATGHTIKKHEPLTCPTSLHFGNDSTLYTLKCIVNHEGDYPESGHYTSLLYDQDADNFLLIDDDAIYSDVDINNMRDLFYLVSYVKSA